jgi:hypothetical protein
MMLEDKFMTKDYLDARLADVRANFYRALMVQAVVVVGLIIAIFKFCQ